jgi:hypothetical protein
LAKEERTKQGECRALVVQGHMSNSWYRLRPLPAAPLVAPPVAIGAARFASHNALAVAPLCIAGTSSRCPLCCPRRRSLCIAKFSSRCAVVRCGNLFVVASPLPAALLVVRCKLLFVITVETITSRSCSSPMLMGWLSVKRNDYRSPLIELANTTNFLKGITKRGSPFRPGRLL